MIGISDFGKGCKIEEDDEQGDEACHAEVGPLHVFEALVGVYSVREEDARGEEGCDEAADSLDTLAEVEADFTVSWGATDSQEAAKASSDTDSSLQERVYLRICSGLQCRQTSADNLNSCQFIDSACSTKRNSQTCFHRTHQKIS